MVAGTLIVVMVVLFWRSLGLMLGEENPRLTDMALMSRKPLSVEQLNKQASELRRLAKNIDTASFQDIRVAFERTIVLVERANTEIAAQYQAWEQTRGRMKDDEVNYLTLRANLENSKRLQEAEIIRLKRALDEAQTPSFFDSALTGSFTFLLGVISSLLATAIYPPWRRLLRQLRQRTSSDG
jgi:hypothetical protein